MGVLQISDFGPPRRGRQSDHGHRPSPNWLGDRHPATQPTPQRGFLTPGRKFRRVQASSPPLHRSNHPLAGRDRRLPAPGSRSTQDGLVSVVVARTVTTITAAWKCLAGFADGRELQAAVPSSAARIRETPCSAFWMDWRFFRGAFGLKRQEKGLRILRTPPSFRGTAFGRTSFFEKIYPAVIAAGFCTSNASPSGWESTIIGAGLRSRNRTRLIKTLPGGHSLV